MKHSLIARSGNSVSPGKRFSSAFLFLCLTALFLSGHGLLTAQNDPIFSTDPGDYSNGAGYIDDCDGEGNPCIVLPPATEGEDYAFQLPLAEGLAYENVEFMIDANCQEGEIDIDSDGWIRMYAGNFCQGEFDPDDPEVLIFYVTAQDISTGEEQLIEVRLRILRYPFALVYVLDRSGSMNRVVQGTGLTRWHVLKQAVELFATRLDTFGLDYDRIAMSYFFTNVLQPDPPMGSGFLPATPVGVEEPDRTSAFIVADMNNKQSGGTTAMGKGLQDAVAKLNSIPHENTVRSILLFTDGRQNVVPLVNPDGQTLTDGTSLNDSYPAQEGSIKIFTIGIELYDTQVELLEQIAAENRGVALVSNAGIYAEFHDFFNDQFSLILKGFSPQVVLNEHGTLATGTAVYSFPLNRGISKLHIQLIHGKNQAVKLKLKKNGTDLTGLSVVRRGGFYLSHTIGFPLKNQTEKGSDGNWELVIEGNEGADFILTVFADEHWLNYSCQLSGTGLESGDPVQLEVSLDHRGSALLPPENKVRVLVFRPGEDIGHLLATYPWEQRDTLSDVDSPAEQKFLDLLHNDTAFYNEMKYRESILQLDGDQNGIYRGNFTGTSHTGSYKFVFLMEGEIPGFGNYRRREVHTRAISFGKVSNNSSEVTKDVNPDKGTATVTVRLVNRYRKYLGPGLSSRLGLSLKSEKASVEKVHDHLDGRYSFLVSGLAPGEDPVTAITYRGQVVREKALSKIDSPANPLRITDLGLLLLLIILILLHRAGNRWIRQNTPEWAWWVLLLALIIILVLKYTGILGS